MNRYLFFISDQFESDSKLEKKERDKFTVNNEDQYDDEGSDSNIQEEE